MSARPEVRQSRRARSTGTVVLVIDSHHPDAWFADDGGRWVTVCDVHGGNVNHETLALARSWASSPEWFCDECSDAEAAR